VPLHVNVEDDTRQKVEKSLLGMIIQEEAWSAVTWSTRQLDRSQRHAQYKTCAR